MRVAVVVVVVAVAAVVLVLHHLLLRRPLPRIAGSVDLDGVEAPVRIVRDRHGVPHIEAETMRDAAFATGFVHAQDRGWQMELLRHVASGRIAEIAGAEAVAADRLLRRLGFLRTAVAEEALLGGDERAMMEAYAAGVNAVLCSGAQPRPIELRLLGITPEPWRPAHSLACARVVGLGLALDWDYEIQRLRLLAAVGPAVAALFDLEYPEQNPTILAETLTAAVGPEAAGSLSAGYEALAQWLPTGTRAAASNNWVVAGSRTATGRPMLCNDPHLLPAVPSVWYQLHVRAGDDFESAGVGFPGTPFVVIGHNRHIAWGFTNSFADVQDLVVEEFTDEGATEHRTESGAAPCTLVEERIRVRKGADVLERVVVTRHGPVVERFTGPDGRPRGLSLQWHALSASGDVPAGLLALQRAATFAEFRAATARLNVAPQNAVYADCDGHIGYVCAGPIPVRPGPASRLPLTGWDADRRFTRILGPEELPQALDPEEGIVVTANNRVVGPGFPHHIAFDTMNGYRALRITQLLAGRNGLDAALMARVQMDIVSPPGRAVAVLLAGVRCGTPLAEEARAALCGWDGAMSAEATEPAVYSAFMRELCREVLAHHCGDAWTLVAGEMDHPVFGHAGNLVGRITPWMLQRWQDGDTALLGERTWDQVAAAALEAAVAGLRRDHGRPARWRWGRLHRLPLQHAMGRKRVLALLFNQRAVEVGGDTDTVLQTAYEPGLPYRTTGWAPSWRQIIDVGDWDACTGIHYPGQSGHPGSRHYRDLTADWQRNRQHPMSWSQEAVERGAVARLVLRPRPPGSALGVDDEEAVAA